MSIWLKRYWLIILISFAMLFVLYLSVDGLIARITWKSEIKEKDENISELKQSIKDSKGREKAWKKLSEDNWKLAMEKEVKLRKKDREMMVKIAEKRELKKKIQEMPPSVVIIQTVEIIDCSEIQQQEQGIVFSLNCAMENLAFLEGFSFVRREADDWMSQYFTCKGEVVDLKNVIIDKDEAYAERGIQLGKKDGIIANWKGKFNLSEKRGKRSWWKGAKIGGIIGGIIGFFLGK